MGAKRLGVYLIGFGNGVMTASEAKENYFTAEKLYRQGQFASALEMLDAIDKAYPKQKNIMLLRAYCLAELYRAQQAVMLCDRILGRFDCPEAHDLKMRLVKNDGLPSMPGRDYGTPLPKHVSKPQPSRFRQFLYRVLVVLIDLGVLLGAISLVTWSILYAIYG